MCVNRELSLGLGDNLEGGMGLKKEGIYVYLLFIHLAVPQKPTQHCKKAIILN